MAIKSEMWKNEMNFEACWAEPDTGGVAAAGVVVVVAVDGRSAFWGDVDLVGFDDDDVGEVLVAPFCGDDLFVVVLFDVPLFVPFGGRDEKSSSLHMKISSQCSSRRIAS